MLSIIILEDNLKQRKVIQEFIENRLNINPTPNIYDAKILLSTSDPQKVLNYLSQNENTDILAFLDIDLQTDIDGIEVASHIKNMGKYSQIVFVTADADALRLTIKQHIAPLDYVTKGNSINEIRQRIYEIVDTAYHRYQLMLNSAPTTNYFVYSKMHGFIEKIPLNQIFYITIQPKKYKQLRVYSKKRIFDCSGTLKEYENKYSSLVFADRQSLINLNTVKSYNEKTGIVYFDDEQQINHKVSVRRRHDILVKLSKNIN